MTTKEMIAVMKAYDEGKQIQYRDKRYAQADWRDINIMPCWNWQTSDYRIKPVEKEEMPKLMTNRQFAEWCLMGKGMWTDGIAVYTEYNYGFVREEKEVACNIRIRRSGSDEWIEPTVDIYKRDCKH